MMQSAVATVARARARSTHRRSHSIPSYDPYQPTVVIIGGGLAGLCAAWSLRQARGAGGVRLVVLEAGSRLGGRVLSPRSEARASDRPAMPNRGPLLHLARALGLPTHPHRQSDFAPALYLDQRWIQPTARRAGLAPEPSIHDAWRRITDRFPAPTGWANDPLGALERVDPRLHELSVAQLLQRENAPRALRRMVDSLFPVLESPHCIGALSALMRAWSMQPGEPRHTLGVPMDRLVDALAMVPDVLRLRSRVASVRMLDDGRHRVVEHGGRAWIADHVVFALPAPQAARIDVSPGWPPALGRALDACTYGPVIEVLARTTRDLCALDGLPLAMMADRGFSACTPVPGDHPQAQGLKLLFVGDRARALHDRAARGGSLADEAIATLVRARPAAAGCLRVEHCAVWTAASGPGALPYFRPGVDVAAQLTALARPHHRRYVAGDHTEASFAGWDGAVASGMRVAKTIDDTLSDERATPPAMMG